MNKAVQAMSNPALGVAIFALGGLAGAVFYLPFKKVKNWAWESYWLVYAFFGLLLVPWGLAMVTSPNITAVLSLAPRRELLTCFLCGMAWGIGGLTWGLMIRYLGVGLGIALGSGICSATGTLAPKMLKGEFSQLFQPGAGIISFIGVVVSLAGIVFVGLAGVSKERELPEEQKKRSVAEYDFKKGLLAALFSGLISSAMSFGLGGGPSIQALAETTVPFTSRTWSGMPVLVIVLLGGFTVNVFWCLYLNMKNKTIGDYVKGSAPLMANLLFAGLAGAIWCSQFVCFKTGEPAMGRIAYVGWALLMASMILFSTLLGLGLGEWKGVSSRTRRRLAIGLLLLVLTSVIAGISGSLAQADSSRTVIAPTTQKKNTPRVIPDGIAVFLDPQR